MSAFLVCFNTFFVFTFLGEELIISTLLDFYHFPLTFDIYIYIFSVILDYFVIYVFDPLSFYWYNPFFHYLHIHCKYVL